eukprot:TRINITY_DN22747_c0_g1_i3.p1 TRINITY_DN22747_c0_g1~~TRINITY_DN22747_c0_g1_i3.p1  ORF type:complete len:1100 (-),score=265.71 TRINITY_DN22747_c0_g1_i3:453-3530(-)
MAASSSRRTQGSSADDVRRQDSFHNSKKCLDPKASIAAVACCRASGCTNKANGGMTRNGQSCSDTAMWSEAKWARLCNTWNQKNKDWCRLTCWNLGRGRDGENCSAGAYVFEGEHVCSHPRQFVSYDMAEQMCAARGLNVCDQYFEGTPDSCENHDYSVSWKFHRMWTPELCQMKALVNLEDGFVHLAHSDIAKQNPIRVQWLQTGPPTVCEAPCESVDGFCECPVVVTEETVFEGRLPKPHELVGLQGAPAQPSGECGINCNNEAEVQVFGANTRGEIDDTSIFSYNGKYYKNVRSVVSVGKHKFRNPPRFSLEDKVTAKTGTDEIFEFLEHLFMHPNVAPFFAHRMIQRLTSSNPSPAYIQAVAEAFESGTFDGQVFSGRRGCLRATWAATLLHPEARDPPDETKGSLREPLLKVIHFMRSMGYADRHGTPVLQDLEEYIGMAPFASPDVFNFYTPDYAPARFPAGVTGPEFMIFTAPSTNGFLNGMFSMLEYGVTSCSSGFGKGYGRCTPNVGGEFTWTADAPSNFTEQLEELNLLLTAGSLSDASKQVATGAYEEAGGGQSGLKAAQKVILMTPEFNTQGPQKDLGPRGFEQKPQRQTPGSYKATVYLYMAGGCDSFNLLMPYSNDCPQTAQYHQARTNVAIPKTDMLPIKTEGQLCSKFALNPGLPYLRELYNRNESAIISNIGSLVEPMTLQQFKRGGAKKCVGLFSHNDQKNAAQTLKCQASGTSAKGVGGRLADALAAQGYSTTSFSISGNAVWSNGVDTNVETLSQKTGASQLHGYEEMKDVILNISARRHKNLYAEEYQKQFQYNIEYSDDLGKFLENHKLETESTFNPSLDAVKSNKVASQLYQVAKLVKTRQDRKAERDFFFISQSGFDMHQGVETLPEKLKEIDDGIRLFVAEMKAQGVWKDITLMSASDFGRTITSNGRGTDHAWAGNMFVVGGDIQGGRVYNEFPESLMPGNPQDVGRGRFIPKYPWENMVSPVAKWMGLSDSNQPAVFPNLQNFDSSLILREAELFRTR